MENIGYFLEDDIDILRYNLEERREMIKDYYRRMERLFPRMPRYIEDVEHARTIGLNSSVVSHLTYNLLLTISKATKDLNTYDYLRCWYLLDDEYDKAYEIWKEFSENATKIKELISSIDDSFFDDDIDLNDFLLEIIPASYEKIDIDTGCLIYYLVTASNVGAGLFKCLDQKLRNTEGWLESLKNGLYLDYEDDEDYDYAYLINYNLYKKEYWPQEGKNFRCVIEEMNFHRPVTVDYLEEQFRNEMGHFVTNPVGRLWRDYHNDNKALYTEAKRINLQEQQWKYYFMNICRFEEYERWIEELRTLHSQPSGFGKYVLKPEKRNVVVTRIKELVDAKDKPQLIMKPIRAAIDAGAIERPNWESFIEEFGVGKIKSKASFNDYTNPMKTPYDDDGYSSLKEEFYRLINE